MFFNAFERQIMTLKTKKYRFSKNCIIPFTLFGIDTGGHADIICLKLYTKQSKGCFLPQVNGIFLKLLFAASFIAARYATLSNKADIHFDLCFIYLLLRLVCYSSKKLMDPFGDLQLIQTKTCCFCV